MKKYLIFALTASLLALLVVLTVKYRKMYIQNEELKQTIALQENVMEAYRDDIRVYLDKLSGYESRLSEYKSLKIEETESGLRKKGNVYLISDQSDMSLISNLIKKNEKIEPGVLAAEASYRLCKSFELPDWFYFGTVDTPFKGTFDGDGHNLWGNFASEAGFGTECFMYLDSSAVVENLEVKNRTYNNLRISVSDMEDVKPLINNLNAFPGYSITLKIETEYTDMSKLAACLKGYWEKGEKRNGNYLEISFYPYKQTPEKTDFLIDFESLFGEEAEQIIRKELEYDASSDDLDSRAQNSQMLSFLRAEQVEDLSILSFAIKGQEEKEYHLILQGLWEGKEINLQHLVIPSTQFCTSIFGNYYIRSQDINYDGKEDLLIHEGGSGGSGGSWDNYRGVIWVGEEFIWYPSFPEQLNFLEFYRKRLIASGQCGAPEQWINVYEVVDGEYVLSKELWFICVNGEETLYYYEMGKLVKEHDITGGYEEVKELYPDLYYWR